MLPNLRPLRMSRCVRRFIIGLASFLTLAGGIARADSHQSSHQLRDRAAEARAQEQAIAGDIAAQSGQIDSLESDIGALRHEVARLEGQLGRSKSLLRAVERELAEKKRTLVRAREQLAVGQRRLGARLVEIYTSNEPDTIAVVLGAQSLDELIDLIDVRSRVLEQDTELVNEIEALRTRVTRERDRAARLRQKRAIETARIEEHTNERRTAMSSLVARRDSLSSIRAARQRSLASVQVQRREWEAQADALEAQSARITAAIAAAPLASSPTGDQHLPTPTATAESSSGFIWPVRGTLVSPYGQRWGRLHSGIDIAAPAGTLIAASASGQVVYAGSMSGYGLIVVIQHSGGVATAYAHNSSITVSVGESVVQGQTIAAVGCTGHCYGDHVHFEVRVGGGPVDPMGYL
jgi:murein DD-endopeptidase MepM/ murein hydrolase activator NlpD